MRKDSFEIINISNSDLKKVEDYRKSRELDGKKIQTVTSKLRTYLNEPSTPPLEDWGTDTLRDFLDYADWRAASIRNYIPVIRDFLTQEGCDIDWSSISTDDFMSRISSYFTSFSQFNAIITSTLRHVIPDSRAVTGINKYSSSRAVLYLLWLGFNGKEISEILNTEYDEVSSVIIHNNHAAFFGGYKTMVEFFKRYSNAKSYTVYSDIEESHQRRYSESEYFIKSQRNASKPNLGRITHCSEETFGISYDQALWSGRFNRVYKYAKENNIDMAERLDIFTKLIGVAGKESESGLGSSRVALYLKEYGEYCKARKILESWEK